MKGIEFKSEEMNITHAEILLEWSVFHYSKIPDSQRSLELATEAESILLQTKNKNPHLFENNPNLEEYFVTISDLEVLNRE